MSDIERAKEALRLYNARVAYLGNSPPHAAILELVTRGVDVDETDFDKWTLLHLAARYGHTELVKYLRERGSDIHARNIRDSTPLHLAAMNGNTETVKYLLARGANIWTKRVDNLTVLDCDDTGSLPSYRKLWEGVLGEIKNKEYKSVNTTQDLYHLASVMKPENPQNVPPPKEFIRILFLQYIPHEPKFNAMYEEIFSQQRTNAVEDLQALRQKAAKQGRGVVL